METASPFTARAADGLAVEVALQPDGIARWSVANDSGRPVAVDRVALVSTLRHRGPVRMYRHGYQSWSATGACVVGHDGDPSRADGSIELLRGMHHADPGIADAGELRSELVTVLADEDGAICAGFDGGSRHDGTVRVRAVDSETIEVVAEAFLGGAVLAPGARRELHALRVEHGEPAALLERWADWAGSASRARTDAPYRLGWCSWYQYFHNVTEDDVRANLARARDWPIEVFQVDDGYQRAIGDWLTCAPTFPSPLERLASDITTAGCVPGVWLAPFLAAPDSDIAQRHPTWMPHHRSGNRLVGMVNPGWDGVVWTLDTTHPAVLEHLETTARTFVDMGWRYLKLDFTYAPALPATDYHDPSRTPAERVRAGYDAIRRGAGDDAFILGCGAPLGPCIGVVDAMRIGPDVAPRWHGRDAGWRPPGYEDTEPATVNAWRNTLTRAFQHRRLWVNDPDCVMLRADDTDLDGAQVQTWAHAAALSGGLVAISDDLARLGPAARTLLGDVLDVGRRADDAARRGVTPRCPDVLERSTPTTLEGPAARLVADPGPGSSQMTLS